MPHALNGRTIAILATDGFEQSELTEPKRALEEAGATVHVISPKAGTIRGWDKTDWGEEVAVDLELEQTPAGGLRRPGAAGRPDQPRRLRIEPRAVAFVRAFFEAGKPVGAICHGPWLLVEADVVRGRKVTSWPSIRTDLENAGADWVDQEVVVDQGLVTSRKPGRPAGVQRQADRGVRRGPPRGPAPQRVGRLRPARPGSRSSVPAAGRAGRILCWPQAGDDEHRGRAAKNDALDIRLAMIWVSTMRLSRASMQRIHARR